MTVNTPKPVAPAKPAQPAPQPKPAPAETQKIGGGNPPPKGG